jgi:hypothetical protein
MLRQIGQLVAGDPVQNSRRMTFFALQRGAARVRLHARQQGEGRLRLRGERARRLAPPAGSAFSPPAALRARTSAVGRLRQLRVEEPPGAATQGAAPPAASRDTSIGSSVSFMLCEASTNTSTRPRSPTTLRWVEDGPGEHQDREEDHHHADQRQQPPELRQVGLVSRR